MQGNLNPRQDKILNFLILEGPMTIQRGLTAEKYIKITETSRATSTRDLQDLVKKGVLVKKASLNIHVIFSTYLNL